MTVAPEAERWVAKSTAPRLESWRWKTAAVALAMSMVAAGCSSGTTGASSIVTVNRSTTTVTTVAAVGSGATSTTAGPTKTIMQLAQLEGSLTSMLKLLPDVGLVDVLNGPGPFSLIAPSDTAFAKLDKAMQDRLTKNPRLWRDVLRYGVVPKRITTADITRGQITTLEGSVLNLKATGGKFPTVNGVAIIKGARGTNGIVLVVDTVLIPPDLPAS